MIALTTDRAAYLRRCQEVANGAPACNARGRHKVRCVLPPGHEGNVHEGNGFDEWGPMYVCWEDA